MPISAGDLNRRVQFQRQTLLPPGGPGFSDLGTPVWAAFKEFIGRPRPVVVGRTTLQARAGTLTIRDSAFARTISPADSVVLDGARFEIQAVSPPVGPDGALILGVTQAPSRPLYAQETARRGEAVVVRRISVNGSPEINVPARAIVTGYQPDELVGGIVQGMRKVVLLAEDLDGSSWPFVAGQPPIKAGGSDRIVVRGAPLTPVSVDDSTHRVGGVLNAYEISAKG